MSLFNRNIFKFLQVMLAFAPVALMTGCINDSELPCPDGNGGSYITIRVVAPKAVTDRAATRAIPDIDNTLYWGDNYISEKGLDFENALLKDEFDVFISEADGTLITKLNNLICIEATSATDEMLYSFTGDIPADAVEILKTKSDARIHITANSGSDVSLTSGLIYSHIGQPSESFTAIPMWGVKSFDFTGLQPGQNDVGDIRLLRSMAKVEIVINSEVGTNQISELTSAMATGVNGRGYVLPKGWNYGSVTETEELSYENSLNPLLSVGNITGLAPTEDKSKIVFYLPETANGDGIASLTLDYKLIGGLTKSNQIKFAKYVDGAATSTNYDIVRNHLYRFEVYLRGGQSDQFQIKYTVCQWQEYEINPPTFD